jgi:SAM-dependent methyltransferase
MPMTQLYPENFARFYDVIYHQLRDGVDNAYFINEISQTDGRILEVGVGTGRLFIDALHQGADIFGIDISQSMIEVLSEKLSEEQAKRISLQNVIDFSFDFKFDLIIAPFRVLMHVLEKEEQLLALNNIYKHLNEGGRFIFDAFIPELGLLINGIENQTDFEGEYEKGKMVKRTVSTRPSLLDQTIQVKFEMEWDEDSGRKSDVWIVPLRFFFRYELEHLIERSYFAKNYKILGDYEGNELQDHSKDFIITCQRKS